MHEEWLLVCRNGGRATGERGGVTVGERGGGLTAGRFRGLDCEDPAGAIPRVRPVDASLSATECEPEFAATTSRARSGATTSSSPPDDCDPPEEPPPPPPPTTYVSGHVYYFNYADSVAIPLPRARVYIKTLNNSWTSPWTMTYEDGSFTVQCPPAGITTAILEVWSKNDDVVVVDTDTARTNNYIPPAMAGGNAVDASSCASQVTMYVTSPRQAELFHNHLVAIGRDSAVAQHFRSGRYPAEGESRHQAAVQRECIHRTIRYRDQAARNDGGFHHLTFREEDATGTWGQFVAAHEYAHAAHHMRLGGLTGFRRINSCRPHAIGAVNSMGCAAVEGFADFWATLTRWPTPASGSGGRVHHIYDDLSNNRFLYNDGNAPQDGARVEGAVASFLLDLVDGIGTDTVRTPAYPGIVFQDSLQLSPGLITGAVKECKIFTYFPPYPPDISNHSLLRANGIDHWAWQIGDNGPNPAIPPRPDVRRLWLCNLYGARCVSRSVVSPFP